MRRTCALERSGVRSLVFALAFAGAVGAGASRLEAQAAKEPLLSGHFALVIQNVRLLSNVRNRLPTALDANAGGIDLTLRLRDSRWAAQLYFVEMNEQAAGTGKYSSLAMTALYGSPTGAAELGLLRRPGHSPTTDVDLDQMYSALRVGGRGSTKLGTTPITLGGRAAVYVPLGAGRAPTDSTSRLRSGGWQRNCPSAHPSAIASSASTPNAPSRSWVRS